MDVPAWRMALRRAVVRTSSVLEAGKPPARRWPGMTQFEYGVGPLCVERCTGSREMGWVAALRRRDIWDGG